MSMAMPQPPPRPSDAELERLARAMAHGDGNAASAFVLAVANGTLNCLIRYGVERADAEDAFQDVLVRVINSIDQYGGRVGSFRGWYYTIVRHRAIDLRRSRSGMAHRLRPLPEGEWLDEPAAEENETAPAVAVDFKEREVWIFRSIQRVLKGRELDVAMCDFCFRGRTPAKFLAFEWNCGEGAIRMARRRAREVLKRVYRWNPFFGDES